MKDNRRSFIKKSASMAAALSLGGASSIASSPFIQKAKKHSALTTMAKDAGSEFSNAYFGGVGNEKNRYLVELAKQMDVLGAVAGLSAREAGLPDANAGDYEVIAGVRDAYKKVGLNYHVVEG